MITPKENITGLFGFPIKHSLSPQMHNAAFEKLGLRDWQYQLFEIPSGQLNIYVDRIKTENIRGVNVTIPYKVEIINFLDQLDPLAKKIGAVNTIKNNQGVLSGFNTDAPGFLESLEQDLKLPMDNKYQVLIMGAGGAARAISLILAEKNIINKLFLYDKLQDKTKDLAKIINKYYNQIFIETIEKEKDIINIAQSCNLIINASGIGSSHNVKQSPLPLAAFHNKQYLYDLGYNPSETEFLKLGKAKGAKTSNGLGMLVRQGALAFEIFTGKKAPVNIMKQVVIS